MAVITITENAQRVKTVLPNGNIIRSEVLPVAIADQRNAIGEKKRWEIDFTTDASLFKTTLYINPALFVSLGAVINFSPPGYNYYTVYVPEGGSIGAIYEAALVTGIPTPKLLKNYRVAVRVTGNFTFTVTVEFYMTYDANGFLDTTFQDNVSRFLKDIKTNPVELEASDPDSVYTSSDRAAKVFVMQQKYNGDNGYIVSQTAFKGIFYGAGNITNGSFVMKRGGVVVDELSSSDDTDVEFYIDSPNGVENVVVWLLRTSTNDASQDFIQNYAGDWKQIFAGNSDGSKIIGPYTNPQIVDADSNTYRSTFKINASALTIGETYRLIGMAYEPQAMAVFEVGIGIGDPVDVADSPCFDGTGFNLEGIMSDYNIAWSGNDVEACIEERMQSVIQMSFTGDKWKDYLLSRLGLVGTNDIRRYLTQITCTIYREFTDSSSNLVRHIYATGTMSKTSPLTYSNTSNISSSFPNNGTAEFTFDWRNRYESGTLNLQSLINGVNVTPFDNQYWGGKTFKVEWEFKFFYDDYFAPFTDIVRFGQQLRVKDYVTSPTMELLQTSGDNPESVDVCFGSNLCLKAGSPDLDFDGIGDNDFKLISTIEPAPGNVSVIEEAEDWVGNELPQLTTDKIYDQEEDFGETEAGYAKFCVNTTKLTLNLPYKITAMAKPNVEGCIRSTELLEDRVTEVYDQRVPEECFN